MTIAVAEHAMLEVQFGDPPPAPRAGTDEEDTCTAERPWGVRQRNTLLNDFARREVLECQRGPETPTRAYRLPAMTACR
jgi:hypothetical protein